MNKNIKNLFISGAVIFLALAILIMGYNYLFSDLNVGKRYFKYFYYDGAIQKFQEIITRDPENIEAHLYLGLSYGKKRDYKTAMKELDWVKNKTIKLKFSPDTYNDIGMVYYLLELYPQSIAEFKKAVEIDPKHADAHFNLASAYAASGKNAEAIVIYRKVLEFEPRNVYAHWNLAVTLEKTNDMEGAKKHWLKYIELVPGVFRNPEVEKHIRDLNERLGLEKNKTQK